MKHLHGHPTLTAFALLLLLSKVLNVVEQTIAPPPPTLLVDNEPAPQDPLEVLESALREVFTTLMTLVDEEDAVLLYRCTRIAEASPLLLEACDQRRASMEDGLADKLNLVWQATRPRLLGAVERAVGSVGRGLEQHERAELQKQLENARRASKLQELQLAVEKEAAVKEALRLREEDTQRAITEVKDQTSADAEAHKLRAESAIAKAQVQSRDEVLSAANRSQRARA